MSFFAKNNEQNPDSRNVGGIKVITVNLVMLLLTLALFCVVFYTTFRISTEYRESVKATDDYIYWEKAAHTVHVGSDHLTEQARLYIESGDPQYARNYFSERDSSKSRENALEGLAHKNLSSQHLGALQKALDLSNGLTTREIYAIRLKAEASGHDAASISPAVEKITLSAPDSALNAEAKAALARKLVFNPDYSNAKKAIMDAISVFLDYDLAKTKAAQARQMRELGQTLTLQRYAIGALFLLNLLIFCLLLALVVKPLRLFLKAIKQDKKLAVIGAYEFRNLAATYNKIFALKEKNDRILRRKAEHDPLTGLLNRGAFNALVEMLKNSGEPAGLLLVDVDKFKKINDTWGHKAGDAALCLVASLLHSHFRSGDYCARLGGDEFAVILKGASSEMERIVIDKITAINAELQNPADKNVPSVSISVGGAFSERGFVEDLYQQADLALYEVKDKGRRGCRFYEKRRSDPAASQCAP